MKRLQLSPHFNSTKRFCTPYCDKKNDVLKSEDECSKCKISSKSRENDFSGRCEYFFMVEFDDDDATVRKSFVELIEEGLYDRDKNVESS